MHTHSHSDGPAPASRGVKLVLAVVMAALFALTVAGLVWLWPAPGQTPDKRPWLDEGAQLVSGTLVSVDLERADGQLNVRLDSGQTVVAQASPGVPAETMRPGESLQLIHFDAGANPVAGADYVFFDYHREWPMIAIAALFVLAVFAVARLKGLLALVGLGGALAMVWLFTLPALTAGKNPLLVALATAGAVLFIVIYLAHGVSVKSTTALLGTFAGIAVVACLAWAAIGFAKLTPLAGENMAELAAAAPAVDVNGVLLCGMVLAGVGVLNDVTITQASAVWELRAAAPGDSRLAVFRHAMSIGRDHIASTVYTIAFAYVGTSLSLLTIASTLDFSLTSLLTFEDIAEELIPTLVASIGLVLAIPITTALGAWLAVKPKTTGPSRDDRAGRP
ncbi:MAG: YibE/F family protein [Propionibacteriaceae bacterium]|jgi:uncharacterized membrane protein|nr:YibE/F family protein [Propionibacteriaceae bacterium]